MSTSNTPDSLGSYKIHKAAMVKTTAHKILKTSAAALFIAHSIFSPVALKASEPNNPVGSEHLFEIADETRNFSRDDLLKAGRKTAVEPQFFDNQDSSLDGDEWNMGWGNDAVIDEKDLAIPSPEPENKAGAVLLEEAEAGQNQSRQYPPTSNAMIPIDQDRSLPSSNPMIDEVLHISNKKRFSDSPEQAPKESDAQTLEWEIHPPDSQAPADISSAKTRPPSLVEHKTTQPLPLKNQPQKAKIQAAATASENQIQRNLGEKIVTVDPYLDLQEEKKGKKYQQALSAFKKAEAAAPPLVSGNLSGPGVPKAETAKDKAESPPSVEDQIIAQTLPDRSLSNGQGKTPSKTILINFNNVSIIEYIRFISRISNHNFIFDENDLQFNVTIISEEPTSIENVMTALIQELRIHGLYLIEQGNNLIIHRNKEERSISRVNTNGAPEVSPRESELVTQVFKLNTLDPQRAQRIVSPLLSNNAIIEVSEDTRHIIITDLVTNIKEVEILLKDIDSPNSGLVIGQYVVRNAFIDNLIELAKKIMDPIAQGQSLTFVPHPAAKSIFIVSSPFLVERTISVLQHLDQFQGATRIYDLSDLKFQQITPKEGAPGLAPDRGTTGIPQEGVITPTPGVPTLPALPLELDLPEFAKPIPGAPTGTTEGGKWELGNDGSWIFRPGFPVQKSSTELPQGEWILGPQDLWYFQPEGTKIPFQREGAAPSIPGLQKGKGKVMLPGEAPKGTWGQDKKGSWVFQLAPGEEIKPERFSRPTFTEEELPLGNIERTQFYLHKLQYRRGEDIVNALRQISDSLNACETANQDLICTIQSVQWLEASNLLVFAGTQLAIQKVDELVNEIDSPLRQVFIEMLILETTIDDSLNYGVTWGTRSGGGSTATAQAYIGGASPLTAALSGNFIDDNPDASTLATGIGYSLGIIGKRLTHNGTQFATLGALVTAQHNRSDTDVIINPKIITEDNKTAEIFVGINTRFQTNSISNDEGSVITTNFEYRDVGTTLRVTPLIGHGDIITLEIEEEVSRVTPETTTQDANAPTTSISRTTTTVHVPDRHFVIISGMIQDEKIVSRNQFPCLGGIPIIGAAFSAKVNTLTKRNQMLFIRPQIIDTDAEMRQLTSDQQEIYKQKNHMKKNWKYEVDEGMEFLNILPPCCDECE